MSIQEFKQLLLNKLKVPFFLQFNISNDKKLGDLMHLNKDNYTIKVFEIHEQFSLQLKSHGKKEITISELRLDTPVGTLVQKIRDACQNDASPSDLSLELDSG